MTNSSSVDVLENELVQVIAEEHQVEEEIGGHLMPDRVPLVVLADFVTGIQIV